MAYLGIEDCVICGVSKKLNQRNWGRQTVDLLHDAHPIRDVVINENVGQIQLFLLILAIGSPKLLRDSKLEVNSEQLIRKVVKVYRQRNYDDYATAANLSLIRPNHLAIS